MIVIVEREKILKALEKTLGIVEKRTTMPILNSLLLETEDYITIKATNLEKSIIIKIDGKIDRKGKLCIPARKLFEIIKTINENEIKLESEDNYLNIKSGKSSFKLYTQMANDFPKIKNISETLKRTINKEKFYNSIEKVDYAIYPDESRISLNGIYTHCIDNKLRFVASDGYRLSLNEVDYEGEPIEVLIPKKSISEIKKICKDSSSEKIYISIESNMLCIELDNITFLTRLNEAKFPNYKEVIPNNTLKAYIDKQNIISSLEKTLTIADEQTKSVIITLDKNIMKLKAVNAELGEVEDEIEINYDGDKIEIGFNAEFLLQAIEKVENNTIEIALKDSQTAIIIGGDKQYKALVMPIRI